MFREVTMIELKEVLRLWGKGVPKKRVAAQVGLDPKTVRRYLKAATASFESEAAYLARHGLLTDAERSRVSVDAFAPDVIVGDA
jgi:hypothetical protein